MATSDHDIVQTLSKTPEKGFRLLMAKYKEPIYWHIRRLVGTHDDAQDAAQETFVRVFRAILNLTLRPRSAPGSTASPHTRLCVSSKSGKSLPYRLTTTRYLPPASRPMPM